MEQSTAQSTECDSWDPKGKDTTDTSLVLPPSLSITGRIREPPGLERETIEAVPDYGNLSYYPSIAPEDSGAEEDVE